MSNNLSLGLDAWTGHQLEKSFITDDITKAQGQTKFDKVMHEFGQGTLKDQSGKVITDRKQAIAIAYSESGLEKGFDTELEKGGEGSRGGHIIGHTKSGKPVYEKKTHTSYKEFTEQDHFDAEALHSNLSDKHLEDYKKGDESALESRNKHWDIADYHHRKAKALQNETKSYKEGGTKEKRFY